ncbi:hypothetical protein D9628_14140, partial [Staphylococcus aureus]
PSPVPTYKKKKLLIKKQENHFKKKRVGGEWTKKNNFFYGCGRLLFFLLNLKTPFWDIFLLSFRSSTLGGLILDFDTSKPFQKLFTFCSGR